MASPAAEARRRRHLQRGEARAGLSRLSLRINDLGEVQQLLSLHEQQQQHVRHRQRQRRLPPAVAGDVQQRLAESGVVILPSLVDVKLCEAMAAEVHTRVMAAAIDTYDVKGHWLRKDLGPSLIGDGMYPTILGALSTLFADVLEGILGTDPELYEYVCTASVCCLDHTVLIHSQPQPLCKSGDFSFFAVLPRVLYMFQTNASGLHHHPRAYLLSCATQARPVGVRWIHLPCPNIRTR